VLLIGGSDKFTDTAILIAAGLASRIVNQRDDTKASRRFD
jgi:hypothetical protein